MPPKADSASSCAQGIANGRRRNTGSRISADTPKRSAPMSKPVRSPRPPMREMMLNPVQNNATVPTAAKPRRACRFAALRSAGVGLGFTVARIVAGRYCPIVGDAPQRFRRQSQRCGLANVTQVPLHWRRLFSTG